MTLIVLIALVVALLSLAQTIRQVRQVEAGSQRESLIRSVWLVVGGIVLILGIGMGIEPVSFSLPVRAGVLGLGAACTAVGAFRSRKFGNARLEGIADFNEGSLSLHDKLESLEKRRAQLRPPPLQFRLLLTGTKATVLWFAGGLVLQSPLRATSWIAGTLGIGTAAWLVSDLVERRRRSQALRACEDEIKSLLDGPIVNDSKALAPPHP